MEHELRRGIGRWLAVVVLAVAPLALTSAQQAAGSSTTAAAAPTGKPVADLAGVWLTLGGGGGGGDAFNRRPQSEWSDAELPFTPQGREVFLANKPGKGPRQVPIPQRNDPIGGANPLGLYRTLVYSRPFEIVQLPGKIVQVFGWGKIWRTIHTDGRPVPDDIAEGPFWYGYSVGKWEGDTLVVTTMALDGRAWMDEWGTPYSDEARIEERWRRVAPNRLQVQLTVRDPTIYARPWTSSVITYNLQRNMEPTEIIFAPMDEIAFNETIRDPAGSTPKQ